MLEPYASQALVNLKKARGQTDRLIEMMGEQRYCMDLVQQCNAAIGLLQQANLLILESHLHSCGANLSSKDAATREKFIKEILRACRVSSRK